MSHSEPKRKKSNRGPDPERVKIDMEWDEAIKKAVKKPRPPEGWPKPPSRYKKRNK
jgi:hypothetical protein